MKPIRILIIALASAAIASASARILDGEEIYQNNCTRCHIAIHTFAPKRMATVAHHMQVRAMLTREEQSAVIRYLAETERKRKP
ncbi:MAG: cytochrome c [Acidobacteriaceae bacterium]|nr:cytochrome c [Acidobacteriaceae bacterium]